MINNQWTLSKYNPPSDLPTVDIPVSVIISARNEAQNLAEYLPFILKQNYPDFEVVVVDDCSFDKSWVILEEFKLKFKHLKVVSITEHERFKTGKKFALTLGIKAAKNEHLLFTDADCQPASDYWITRMMASFDKPGIQIVLGYSPYKRAGTLLNSFIRFETIKTGINYLSAALKGDAYMGIGRNLAYTKTLFFAAKGFAAHMHILAGDDDLFVNQNATAANAAIEIHPDAFMFTEAKSTLKAWYRQKKRHFGVGKAYQKKHRIMLSWDAASGFLFYILLTSCLIFNFQPLILAGLFMFRLILQLIIYNKSFKLLNGKQLLWYVPVFDLFYYIYLNIFGLIGTFVKTTKWK